MWKTEIPFIKNQVPAACILIVLLCFASLTLKANAVCPIGDLTGDCFVDFGDLKIFANQWLQNPSGTANFNGINTADMLDFTLLASNWKKAGFPLVINEFLASNSSINQDEYGDSDDWIEICNLGDTAIDIGGMYLTDDLTDPTKWMIPDNNATATTIDPNGFLLIWADDEPGEGTLHATFKINKDNDTELGLFDTDGTSLIDSITFSQQYSDISFGKYPDGTSVLRFFAIPTPAQDNNDAYLGIIDDTEFSKDRGFYDSSINVGISCETPGATIYYTLNGDEPNESSTLYTSPLAISNTTTLGARAFKPGWMPTNIDTQTYIFNATDAIKSLPVISIVGDEQKSLFEPDGIMAIVGGNYAGGWDGLEWQSDGPESYNNPMQRGIAFERPVSVELINSADNSGFHINCGMRVAGSDYHRLRYTRGSNWWYNYDKFSFKLFFRSSYGDGDLDYKMFPNGVIDSFKSIMIRGGHNDVINPFIKDELTRRLFKDMGRVSSSGSLANLYLNGEYKAYYNPCERLDEDFFRSWYSSSLDWDVITQRAVRNGDDIAFNNLINFARNNDLSINSNYQQVADKLDITAFVDYLILQLYWANWDWPINNWTAAAERSASGKFRFYPWDMEGSADDWIDINLVGFNSFPTWSWVLPGGAGLNGEQGPIPWLYRALKVNPDFKQIFADRLHKHFYNGGALTDTQILNRFYELRDEMLVVLPSMYMYAANTFVPQRRSIMLNACIAEGMFNLEGPVYNINASYQHGGYASSGDSLTMTNPNPSGTIYYTLDGNEPQTGGSSIYSGPITLNKSTIVKSRVLDGAEWSALTEATYGVGDVAGNLRITEIMYHPQDTNDPNDPNEEYIELKNIGGTSINISLVSFTNGIDFTFGNFALSPGQLTLVVKDVNAFEAQYGTGLNIAGQYLGSLNNGGERIELVDAVGTTIHDFKFKDGWRDITDGDGFSLTIIDPTNSDPNSWDSEDGWRASAVRGGSPGTNDSGIIPNPGDIVINEVLAHSDTLLYDWIELHNTTAAPINIGGWYISDNDSNDISLKRYQITAGTTIPANGHIVFYENLHFNNPGDLGSNVQFQLSENGDDVYLSSGQGSSLTGYRVKEDFDASQADIAFGRYQKSTGTFNFVAMSSNTPGSANAYPKVEPVVINEIMYNPLSGNQNEEYIELHNLSGAPVTLYDVAESVAWKFKEGIKYEFITAPTIPAGGYLIVAKNPASFTAKYGAIPAGVLGPYTSNLDNNGEKLEIAMPGDIDGTDDRKYIRIDRVNYDDKAPWPTGPDANGNYSLSRIVTTGYGNDPNNWKQATPSPGTSNP